MAKYSTHKMVAHCQDNFTTSSTGLTQRGFMAIGNRFLPTLAFFMLHAPLSVVMKATPLISTVHAWGILLLGFIILASGQAQKLPFVAAYIAGSEVLWRMTKSLTFWEQGKYAIILLISLALLQEKRGFMKNRRLFGYFFCLLVSVPLVFFETEVHLRKALSFNLSGPLSLFIAGTYFSDKLFDTYEFKSVLAWLAAPMVGIAFLCLSGLYLAKTVQFMDDSSFLGAGGFGPNQVSTALGAGALMLLFILFNTREKMWFQAMYLCFFFWFLAQAMLTFSRGGVLISMAACAAGILIHLKDTFFRKYAFFWGALIFIICFWFVIPRLDRFTGEMLTTRYENLTTTNRQELFEIDLKLFLKHPIFGVGPGVSRVYHEIEGGNAKYAAHTEFSRMLADHGIFGLLSMLFLARWLLKNYRRDLTTGNKAMTAAFILFGLGSMAHSAMRIVLGPFLLGLSAVMIIDR